MTKPTSILILFLFVLTSMGLNAQDWANLERFREQNKTLIMGNSIENRVVFMGNSITEGWINIHPEFFQENPFVNRGIGGQTTPQMLLRFRQDVINLTPKAVVIFAGINDIAGNTGPSTIQMIVDNIVSMSDLAKANNIKVFICSVLPANRFTWRPEIQPADKVIELNQRLLEYSNQEPNVQYINYYDAMVDDQKGLRIELGADGVHPNLQGYQIMEPILLKALTKFGL